MTYKVAVSKSGNNVLTSSNPNDFIFNSDYASFQINTEGTLLSQTVNSSPKTFTVNHSLGYVPAVYAFAKYPDGYIGANGIGQKTGGGWYYRRFYVDITSSQISFVFYKGASNYDVDIKYYMFNSDV